MEISIDSYEKSIVEPKKSAMLLFVSSWCKPSQLQAKDFLELKNSFNSKIVIETIDVDEHPALSDKFKTSNLPTTVIIAKGETLETLAGYQAKEYLIQYAKHIIKHSD